MVGTSPTIARHKTAMRRREPSKPIRLAVEHGLIAHGGTVFDYGCGYGADVRHLCDTGVAASGWDPVHMPTTPLTHADVVNLGFVVNVIESAPERAETLRRAWSLAERLLVVSARLVHERRLLAGRECEDGLLTARGTFQKFYEQQELRTWIEATLDTEAVAAAPGIFLVFRSLADREAYVATRFRRSVAMPRLYRSERLFREHEEFLQPLIVFMRDRGRPPAEGELINQRAVCETFGSVRRAVSVLQRVFGPAQWDDVARGRREDLLVYLALKRFGGRQRASELPATIRNDVKFHCGTYKRACEAADRLLYSAGDHDGIDAVMKTSAVGKLTPAALYVHTDYKDDLAPVLRAYEGCARVLVGEVPGANIIKLSRGKFQVSYLSYPDFDSDPHPALDHSVVVKLQALDVRYRFFDDSPNPPVLHRKETFLAQGDARYQRFRRLTEQEQRWGLLDETTDIGTRNGWNEHLRTRGVRLSGHRLVRNRTSPA